MPVIPELLQTLAARKIGFVFYPKQNTQNLAKSRQILSDNDKNV
ncbi:hypothetical protein yrohd0001_35800 [Yersinia rohdei ATCC 43380]|nr:hypothetical protein yrohd0001_35800 [Yersinia rohdei ATCC 43380]